MKILCLLGFHKKKVIGTAIYPHDTKMTILTFGCVKCQKKLESGMILPTDQVDTYLAREHYRN